MSDLNNDPKIKIMEVARVLFATNGFEGTSVREIARLAEVNVASLNYHFSSKEKLFHEILRKGHSDCTIDIQNMAQKGPRLEELQVEIFRYFQTKSHDLMSHFKMLMSSSGDMILPEGEEPGPPGARVMMDMILKETGNNLKDEDLHWALKTLFSHTIHMSLMYNCCFQSNTIPFTSQEDIEKGIRRLTRVVLKDLKG